MATVKRNTSIYDNIPTLDAWYEHKCEPRESVVQAAKKNRRNCGGNVSFSAAPPAVYQYDESQQLLQDNNKRPPHRRQSSSESVKVFLKHYTNKLSRQLSSRSSRS